MREAASALFRWFASVKLAVLLIVILAAALTWGIYVERIEGPECALWYVYQSTWFMALSAMLAVNVLAAMLIRLPWKPRLPSWKPRQIGFLLAHAGVVALLAGAVWTYYAGTKGQLSLAEGETANTILISDRSQIKCFWQKQQGPHGPAPRELSFFLFQPGPVDWPDGNTLDMGECGGVALKVLKFYRHARVAENWVRDERQFGAPALRLSLAGPDGQTVGEDWLTADPAFGGPLTIDAMRFDLLPAPVNSMQDDFLKPPTDMDPSGVLSMHHEGRVYRIPVRENVGKKVPVGESGISVEIVDYLPNAKVVGAAKFTSGGDQPRNPLLELRLHLPGKDAPVRQIASAKNPLLSLEAIYGWESPVKFWYHHPAVAAGSGVEFLHTPDGKLYCRVGADRKYKPRGAVNQGDQVDLPRQFKVGLVEYLPSARREVTFSPVTRVAGEDAAPEAAALLEVTAGGTTQQVWVKRNDSDYGQQMLETSAAPLGLVFGYEELRLPFALQLLKLERGLNPGGMGDASVASTVRLVDKARGIDEVRNIAVNHPLTHDRFSVYQPLSERADSKATMLIVTSDPGGLLKYAGSIMLCAGMFLTFCVRISLLQKLPLRSLMAALVMVPALGTAACAGGPADSCIDWQQWRCLPVQDGGRYKPLDTLAWETWQMIAGRTSVVAPETGQKLDATALSLTTLFEWQGWDRAARGAGKPDKWDDAALLRVDSSELREALGLPDGEKYISPFDLSRVNLRDAKAGRDLPFLRKAAALDNNLRAYRDLRTGKSLMVLPVGESADQPWWSLAELMRTDFDDSKDPTGAFRKAQEQFRRVRAAYLAGSPQEFNEASAEFLATLRESGPQLGDYPTAAIIDLEVAYNHWMPFRLAWVLILVAVAAMGLRMAFRWRPAYAASLIVFGGAIAAMLAGFGMRIAISGRAPVAELYETVVYVALGTAMFGLLLEVIYRRCYVLMAAAVVSTVALLLADNCPATLNPSLRPLNPLLRSDFWLVTHVMSIVLSYALFALATAIGNITLGFYLCGAAKRDAISLLSKLNYLCLQLGVLLLTIGTILGAVWADYSWGRFWGWDPKEVVALITLLAYLAILHARFAGWVGDRRLAALSVTCLSVVVMAWYGINFVVPTGLHSYALGSAGQGYIAAAFLAQFLYVLAATLRSTCSQPTMSSDNAPDIERVQRELASPPEPEFNGM